MSELNDFELERIGKNLVVGNCPNCGYAGKRELSPIDGSIMSVKPQGGVDMVDAVMVICPNCGHISFFKKSYLLKD